MWEFRVVKMNTYVLFVSFINTMRNLINYTVPNEIPNSNRTLSASHAPHLLTTLCAKELRVTFYLFYIESCNGLSKYVYD